ncbi:hypothetical protein SEEH1831_08623, partial [Salmonella enterica subsp. enterica serovar Heidelberg str. 77-1831]
NRQPRKYSILRGLSPLARGTQELNSLTVEDLRFIPAGAGNTPDKSFFPVPVRFIPAGAGNTGGPRPQYRADAVYPRWRGEHLRCRLPFFCFSVYPRWRGEHGHYERIGADAGGLSPLARGTR